MPGTIDFGGGTHLHNLYFRRQLAVTQNIVPMHWTVNESYSEYHQYTRTRGGCAGSKQTWLAPHAFLVEGGFSSSPSSQPKRTGECIRGYPLKCVRWYGKLRSAPCRAAPAFGRTCDYRPLEDPNLASRPKSKMCHLLGFHTDSHIFVLYPTMSTTSTSACIASS